MSWFVRLDADLLLVIQKFSSVVGPNGSGKSNVIDAMLFVFGKRAKQLRLNKVWSINILVAYNSMFLVAGFGAHP